MELPTGRILGPADYLRDESVSCDAAIIGTGAGGAAVAYALAQAGLRVVLLEEGLKWEPSQLAPRASWAYRHLFQERGTRLMSGNVYIPLPGGRAVGGSTLLNSAICFRTPAAVLQKWREELGIHWADAAGLEASFLEIERAIGVAKTSAQVAGRNNLLFKAGSEALGLPGDFISRNAPGCIGCGRCNIGCPVGGKGSVDRNLVPVALQHGAALFTSVRADRLLLQGSRATGVEAAVLDPTTEQPLHRLTVHADKVFLCGGAIGSPLFLLKQGLANSSGQVGNNLRVHPATGVCARFPERVDAWKGATQGYYVPLEHSILETFSATPDVYFTQYRDFSEPFGTLRHIASCGCMMGDRSSGTVRPGGEPGRSSIRYTLLEEDKQVIVDGMRTIARVFFAAGATAVHPGIHGGGAATSQAAFEALCRAETPVDRMTIYASHPLGTCRMSAKAEDGVVSPSGESWDVEGLYLADASVFPTALGVNPQITVMATALQIARGAAARG